MTIRNWNGDSAGSISAPSGEFINRGKWAVNSDEWMVLTAGKGAELLESHDMLILSLNTSTSIRVTNNDKWVYDEAGDFWVGNPDSARAPSNIRSYERKMSRPQKPLIHINPAGLLEIYAGNRRMSKMKLVRADGSVAFQKALSGKEKISADISRLSSGLYLLNLEMEGSSFTCRIILNTKIANSRLIIAR
jgi:hypothetical protein